MIDHSIEKLPDLNSLLIRVQGTLTAEGFPSIYESVLNHEKFHADINLIWNAQAASIKDMTISDIKKIADFVKETEHLRGKSCSAWVFPRGQDYEAACLFKAAFASGFKIRYEIFNNIGEAVAWIQNVQLYGFVQRPII